LKIFIIVSLSFFIFSCVVGKEEELYNIPESKNDGWAVAGLRDVGINQNVIENMLIKIDEEFYKNIHSIIIVKNGKLVFEGFYKKNLSYVDDYVNNTDIEIHAMFSVTKSIVSVLTGIAVEKGFIKDIYQKVYPLFTEYDDFKHWNENKSKVIIKNFLTMRHGYDWDELTYPYSDSRNSYNKMYQSNDWVKYVLDLKMPYTPGTVFAYSSGASHTIGKLIGNSANTTVEDFAYKNLFKPLGIEKYIWIRAKNGVADDVYLTTRDMAKIGQMVLDGGVWMDKRIVSEDWINESTNMSVEFDDGDGYSYFWWKLFFENGGKIIASTVAWGYGGQFIFIFKEYNLVVCFTSGNYANGLAKQPFEIIEKYILPSIKQ